LHNQQIIANFHIQQPKRKNLNCFYSKSTLVFYTQTRDRFVVSKHEYAIQQFTVKGVIINYEGKFECNIIWIALKHKNNNNVIERYLNNVDTFHHYNCHKKACETLLMRFHYARKNSKLLLFRVICWIYCLWFERVNGLSKLKFFGHNFSMLKNGKLCWLWKIDVFIALLSM